MYSRRSCRDVKRSHQWQIIYQGFLLIIFSLYSLSFSFTWPEFLFEDQFEVGDLYFWASQGTTGNASLGLDSIITHSGGYAASFNISASSTSRRAYLTEQYDVQDTVFARCYFYLKSDVVMPAGNSAGIFFIGKTGVGFQEGVKLTANNSGDLILGCKISGNGTTVLHTENWYKIEMLYIMGNGSGNFTLWLNGEEEIQKSGLQLPNSADEIRAGWCYLSGSSSAEIAGTLLIDDVLVDTKKTTSLDTNITLIHPDFLSRIGAPVIVVLSGNSTDDKLSVTLSSSNGYNETVYVNGNGLSSREQFELDLRGLEASTYTLTAKLLSKDSKEKAQESVVFEKPYDGDPKVTIDEKNNILLHGKKFFPVSPFGLNVLKINEWVKNKYINVLYGQDWNSPTTATYSKYLDSALANDVICFGPMNTSGPSSTLTDEMVESYIIATKNHQAQGCWSWREEPIENNYNPNDYKRWWDLVKKHDPSSFTHVNFMGLFFHIVDNEAILKTIHDWTYPYMVADVYGFDVYPIEYSVSFEDYTMAMDNMNQWNFGLAPGFSFVQTTDCKLNQGGGVPTAAELRLMAWLMVIHGAKGINWYHYQGTTPPENYVAMSNFVTDINNLTHGILGENPKLIITKKELNNGRVDIMSKEYNDTTFLFAANLKSQKEKVEFTIDSLYPNANISLYGNSSRKIFLKGNTFVDEIQPLGVRIYKIYGDSIIVPIKSIPQGGKTLIKTIKRNGKLAFFIQSSQKNHISLNIYNLLGKNIWNYKSKIPSLSHKIQWNYKDNVVPKGQYILTINSNENIYHKKFFILN